MKALVALGFALSGLALVIWPFYVFTLLLIDASHSSMLRQVALNMAKAGIISYPVVWGISLSVAVRGLKNDRGRRLVPWAVAAPYALVALCFLLDH